MSVNNKVNLDRIQIGYLFHSMQLLLMLRKIFDGIYQSQLLILCDFKQLLINELNRI
jgi:hypothetical protein